MTAVTTDAVNGTASLDKLAALRQPFDSKYIGKLPRVTCKECSNPKLRCPKEDGEHKRRRCDGSGRQDKTACFAFVSPAHIHIDFVGHAHVTDRLLSVDPYWTWEPMSFTPEGSPAIGTSANDKDAVMWIRLTVAGVTRPGVGSCPKDDDEVEKQLIGDALKNAAMRFGVALDLWAKSELESSAHEAPKPEKPTRMAEPKTADGLSPQAKAIQKQATAAGMPEDVLASILEDVTGKPDLAAIERTHAAQISQQIVAWINAQKPKRDITDLPLAPEQPETPSYPTHDTADAGRTCDGCQQPITPTGGCGCPF